MIWDVVIVGAGPAGLTAALYMARFRRKALVLHDGKARVLWIPKTHNVPGFPDGVSGTDLVERMTKHATGFGAEIIEAGIVAVRKEAGEFKLTSSDGQTWKSRSLILATGVCHNQVDIPQDEHDMAVEAAILRYCPVCDGYEHTDQKIGVIGSDSHGAAEALFLRTYSSDITLIPNNFAELDKGELAAMREAGIVVVKQPMKQLRAQPDRMEVFLTGEPAPLSFDVVYPALGCHPRNELAKSFGLSLAETGEVESGAPYETPVEGLFAAGDIVEGLDQISVAIGHGAVAATKAHNWLRDCDGQTLG